MTRKIVLATHGYFAKGIHSSLELICGKLKNVESICAYLEESFDLAKTVEQILNDNAEHELLVITDILGGSVNNEFFKYIQTPNVHLVTGLNLPLLIEVYTQLESEKKLADIIVTALSNGKDNVQYCNTLAVKKEEEEF